MNWSDITVEQYQSMYQVMQEKGLTEIEVSTRLISILYNLTEEDIDNLTIAKFNEYCGIINGILTSEIPGKARKYIKAGIRYYKPNYYINKFNFGQYAEVKAFSGDWVENTHKIMASISEPVTIFKSIKLSHEEKANDFLHAKFVDVYHTLVFFWNVYKNLMVGIKDYMVEEMSMTMTEEEAVKAYDNLIRGLDGFLTPN